ncbi:MAG: hypothetical protein LAN62_08280 [Acidobacteriia bacterium]|nr:hypothetical protein [Terriglobia bacterium]
MGLETLGRLEQPLAPDNPLTSATQPVPASPRVPKWLPSADSPLGALVAAFKDTYHLLFHPIDTRRWVKLSFLCLFLGGGAISAAFHWALGALPAEAGASGASTRLRALLAQHPALLLGAVAVAITLGVMLVYVRALFRFALVGSILRREVYLRHAWRELRPVAGSYFRWLLTALLLVGALLAVGVLLFMGLLRMMERASVAASLLFALLLLGEGFVGLLTGLAITLTDDLVVPIIFAERQPMVAAWCRLLEKVRSEPGAFTLYVVLRVAIAVAVGIAVLLFLFPALVALFSGGILVAVAAVMALQLVGLNWAWTPVTTVLAGTAVLLWMSLLLILLGVAGMPGQVFLQTFGMRFIATRVPALGDLWREQIPQSEPE